ncbi:hypothetical protein [Klebsiella aerogenes]|uniref:hypothetical protein n=1 Tax=Klebsiella aerogenes TaxID=548 RepID=UPI001157A23F|nr:hypothetical protein [Klebsiella aerogenes]
MTNNQLTDQKLTKIVESAEAVISALAGTNDDVHPDDSTKMCRLWDALNDDDATPEVVLVMAKELQERRKADSEPVGSISIDRLLQLLYQFDGENECAASIGDQEYAIECGDVASALRELLSCRSALPVADVVAWSHPTEERMCDIRWRRHDVEPGPLYRHAQPAPVVPDEITSASAPEVFEIAAEAERLGLRGTYASYAVGWNACRAAMLQAEPVTTANKLPFEQWLSQQTGTIDVECGCVMTEVFFHWLRVAYEAGNSPVIPDGSEDTKRLNWLDAQNKRLNEYYGTSYGWKFDANFQRNAMMLNDSNYPVMTVRQAIDEAIAAAPQEAKTERKK